MIATFISANQFRVDDDRTGEFKTGRRIKANCGVDGYKYSTIVSSSFSSSYTTIIIEESVLTSNIIDVLYGIVNTGSEGSFPNHLHDGTEGQGGALPYVTESNFATYSGTIQIQFDNKPDTFIELVDTPEAYDSGKFAHSTSSGIEWKAVYDNIVVADKEDLSGGLVTETWSKNTGDIFSGFMDDTYIYNDPNYRDTNYSTNTQLSFSNTAYTDYNNMLFKFYIKEQIGTKNIISAIFKLYCTDTSSSSINVYRVLKNWMPSEATWNNYKTGSAWSTIGCKAGTSFPVDDSLTADYYDQAICTIPSATLNQWFTMDITSIVQAWSSSSHNEYGIIAAGSIDQFSIGKVYSNEGTDGFRPKLEISYYADASVDITNLLDGQVAITTTEYYNKYILDKPSAKWIVSDGNKYQLTAGLPTTPAFIINVGTHVYDVQAAIWKEWTGSIWKSIETFIDLNDTPNTYSGSGGLFAQSTGSGIQWATVPDSGAQTFIDLIDTPSTYSDGLYARSTASGIVWATVSGGSSDVQSFLDLTDTPNSYDGYDGKYVKVVGGVLEFTTISGGLSDSSNLFELDEYGGLMPVATISGINEVILTAPDSSRWRLIVDNGGNLSTEAA